MNALSPALAVLLVNPLSVKAASNEPFTNFSAGSYWSTTGSPPHAVMAEPDARARPNCGPAEVNRRGLSIIVGTMDADADRAKPLARSPVGFRISSL